MTSPLASLSYFLVTLTSSSLSPSDGSTRPRSGSYISPPPLPWQDVTLRFAAKVLNETGRSAGARGHNEHLLHERCWTVGHNPAEGAANESVRSAPRRILPPTRPATFSSALTNIPLCVKLARNLISFLKPYLSLLTLTVA